MQARARLSQRVCESAQAGVVRAAGLTVEQAAEASTAISALPTINLAGVACVVSCTGPCLTYPGCFTV